MSVFDRYAPFVRDYIYAQEWQSLRGIQIAAAEAIFGTDDHVLLTASTAAGKTEAAFFPIITLFHENPPTSVGCIYIGPLKALINDQFERLTELCHRADIPVWHWHGDVGQTHKARLMNMAIPKLFGDLRFVVIDELHSLLRGDRGGQTLCLIERLSRIAGVQPRRIGLSATIGDAKRAGDFLAAGTGRETLVPQIEAKGSKWRLSLEHFYVRDTQAGEGRDDITVPSAPYVPTDTPPEAADPGIGYIFAHTRGKKCLVFVNSREECEAVTTTLRAYCEKQHEPDRFLIHHGNLSAAFRETAEARMKDEDSLFTTCTTATLELGIDIGRLERAFQIDAPWTVSSFLQRMGRTGRRGQPQEMHFVVREDAPEARALLPATIPWKLLQGIALIQLYLEERWVEPPRLDRLPFSLLYHQTMSVAASCGELSPRALADRVLSLHVFHRITQEDYRTLLRHLIAQEHLQQTERGGLIVGLAGERVVQSFRFYGVFQENEEYTVRCESQEIGTIVTPPPVGEKIAIAGHVWRVLEVDRKRHLVYCEMVKGNVPAYFGECPGDIHTHILERMRQVLREELIPPYLLKNAVARLTQARETARHSRAAEDVLIPLGGEMYALLPWLGSYAFLALERFLRIRCGARLGLRGFESMRPYFMQFTMKVTPTEFFHILAEEAAGTIEPMELLYPDEIPIFDKYDEFLPTALVRREFAYGILDVKGMQAAVCSWANARIDSPARS